jgi:hypothetical protein
MQKRNSHRVRTAAAISALLLGIGVSALPAAAAPPASNPNAPGPNPLAGVPIIFDPGVACEFGVRLDVTGKEKIIGSVKENHKVLSPNVKITATALDGAGNPVGDSVRFTATGTSFYTKTPTPQESPLQDKFYFEVKSTGNNILIVPNPEGEPTLIDLVFVTGNFNYAVTLDKQNEVRTFSGNGRQENICNVLG